MTGIAVDVERAASEFDEPEAENATRTATPFPGVLVTSNAQTLKRLAAWLDEWIDELETSHNQKLEQWAREEVAYRAKSLGPLDEPFVGSCGDVVPLVAMAVDPIVARLDTGIFKSNPVFRFKALKKSMIPYVDALEQFVDYYQKHQLKFRSIALPRITELAKHGSMVLKVMYDCVKYEAKGYDKNWNVQKRRRTDFEGPRIMGVPLGNFLFPAHYQHLQDCPIVMERQRLTYEQLKISEASGKLTNVDKLKGQEQINALNILEIENANSQEHIGTQLQNKFFGDLYEIWFDYDIDGDGIVEKMVATYHRPTQTFLQLRYNWFFHQRKPYVVVPYTCTVDSLYGIGIAEMVLPFQDMLTSWHRHANNNAYLANIRMFVAQKNAGIEQKPKLFTARVFYVENPKEDFIPFNAASDTYPSTLMERQNIIGLAEKRTGVSDYLTGRESPIVGSRATATSTLALIQEGTRRVEETLENIRSGWAEAMEMCLYIWIQWGYGEIVDVVFGNDDVATQIADFFDMVNEDNVNGALAIDLSATDAANNRTVQQQTQLAIIQTMMVYLQKLIEVGQLAVASAQSAPQLTMLIGEVATAARKMYSDLLTKYEIRNPEEYLPDLQQFLGQLTPGAAPGAESGTGGIEGQFDFSALNPPPNGAPPGPRGQAVAGY